MSIAPCDLQSVTEKQTEQNIDLPENDTVASIEEASLTSAEVPAAEPVAASDAESALEVTSELATSSISDVPAPEAVSVTEAVVTEAVVTEAATPVALAEDTFVEAAAEVVVPTETISAETASPEAAITETIVTETAAAEAAHIEPSAPVVVETVAVEPVVSQSVVSEPVAPAPVDAAPAVAPAPVVAAAPADGEISFASLNLKPALLEAITAVGYTTTTPIQARAIPPLLEGRDVLGQAQTGTGKTAAFALPMLQRVNPGNRSPQVLVLAPTRELALQVAESFEQYAAKMPGVRVVSIYGGQDYQVQFRQLDRGAQIVVGTPGRVMDHIRRGSLNLDNLQGMVLDEADEMLRMGFADDVEWVLSQTPEQRQIALFSATMPDPIRKIAQRYLQDPVEIKIKQKTATADTIHQRFIVVGNHQKESVLARILEAEDIDGVIVFVKTKSTTEPLAEYLASQGHRTAALSSDVAQKSRERIVDHLRLGKIDVIIATDVAARGLDVQRISHVINYDMPFDHEGYVHRIGRTGRAGREGNAILFLHPRGQQVLRRLEKATRQKIEPMEIPSRRAINQRRVARFHQRITAAMEHPEVGTFTSLLEQYQRDTGTSYDQIAGALAAMVVGDTPLLIKEDVKTSKFVEPRESRDSRGGRPGFEPAGRRGDDRFERGPAGKRASGPMDTYRIEVGRNHQVKPANIVGAISNEAGIQSSCIGRIDIYDDYSTVDMLAGMPYDMLQSLQNTWVAGRQLNMTKVQHKKRAYTGDFASKDRPAKKGKFSGSKGSAIRRSFSGKKSRD